MRCHPGRRWCIDACVGEYETRQGAKEKIGVLAAGRDVRAHSAKGAVGVERRDGDDVVSTEGRHVPTCRAGSPRPNVDRPVRCLAQHDSVRLVADKAEGVCPRRSPGRRVVEAVASHNVPERPAPEANLYHIGEVVVVLARKRHNAPAAVVAAPASRAVSKGALELYRYASERWVRRRLCSKVARLSNKDGRGVKDPRLVEGACLALRDGRRGGGGARGGRRRGWRQRRGRRRWR